MQTHTIVYLYKPWLCLEDTLLMALDRLLPARLAAPSKGMPEGQLKEEIKFNSYH